MLGATTQDTLAAPPWDLGKRPKTLTELRTMLTNITKSAATTERIVRSEFSPLGSLACYFLALG
eukprot:COSAG04_NODE_6123_length_1403_cov_2.138037_3_plen_63_part_01